MLIAMVLPGWVVAGIDVTGITSTLYNGVDNPWIVNDDLFIEAATNNQGVAVSGAWGVQVTGATFVGLPDVVGSITDVSVSGAGAAWQTYSLLVGPRTPGNFFVQNGGALTSGMTQIGGFLTFSEDDVITAITAGTGSMTVSGPSQWNHPWLLVGVSGDGSLDINTGAMVNTASAVDSSALLGVGPNGLGEVTIDGSSTWSIDAALVVGVWGQGELTISGGAQVDSQMGSVGGVDVALLNLDPEDILQSYGNADGGGTVLVTGPQSKWNVGEQLTVGAWGTGYLTIEDGAQVTVGDTAFIGGMPPVVLEGMEFSLDRFGTGTGHVLVTGDGSLTVEGEETLFVGYAGTGTLDVTAGGDVMADATVIGAAPEADGAVMVSGEGSTLTSTYEITVGGWGKGELTVSDKGHVFTEEVLIGGLDTSDVDDLPPEVLDAFGPAVGPGTVTVTDTLSTLDVSKRMYVGNYGKGTLNVELGGTVTAGEIAVGVASGSHGIVNVSGPDSTLEVDEESGVEEPGYYPGVMIVGGYGQGDVTVSDSGELIVEDVLYVGGYPAEELDFEPEVPGDPDGTGTVTITGPGSTLTGDVLAIGYSAEGTLNIFNDATATSELAFIGVTPDGIGHVVVQNAPGTWTNTGSVVVGAYGQGDLTVDNGHVAIGDVLYIGGYESEEVDDSDLDYAYDPDGTGTVTVTGEESLLQASGIGVGIEGDGTLEILAGAEVQAEGAVVGLGKNGVGAVLVDGPGSTWRIESEDIANEVPDALGEGNVAISNGGQVIVDGTGILNVGGEDQGTIRVGSDGLGTMTISNGGSVTVDALDIGGTDPEFDTLEEYFDPATVFTEGDGQVTVTGDNSSLEVESLIVGFAGSGRLDIDKGASVTSQTSFLGVVPESTGTVEINGGATWDAGANIIVGLWGQGELTILNGLVNTGELYIGGTSFDILDPSGQPHDAELMPNGTGTVTVTGETAWLAVEAVGTLYVGYSSEGTLNIENGGTVTSQDAVIGGYDPDYDTLAEYEGLGANVVGGTVTVTGDGSNWQASEVDVGFSRNGTLEILAGGAVNAEELGVGGLANVTGTVLVSGSGDKSDSTLTLTGELMVGRFGTGIMTIADGADVIAREVFIGGLSFAGEDYPDIAEHIPDGTGTLTVTGGGSTLDVAGDDSLYVGYSGHGVLDILEGGYVESVTAVIAAMPGSTGEVTVDGAADGDGSTWNNTGSMAVGGYGEGYLEISGGGEVYVQDTMYIGGFEPESTNFPTVEGTNPNGTGGVTVTGEDSLLLVGGPMTLHVGYSGEGWLDILSGGTVVSMTSHIGAASGGEGLVYVEDGTWINNGDLYVGGEGDGDLLVAAGGQVLTSGSAFLAPNEAGGAYALVDGEGSAWDILGSLFIGGHVGGSAGLGTLAVSNGGEVFVGQELYVWETGLLTGDGAVTVLTPTTLYNYGTIAPGDNGIGTLTLNGDVVFKPNSVYSVQISNTTADKLEVNGDVTIEGGDVQVDSVGTIVGEHEYQIISANSVTGAFDALDTALLKFEFSDALLDYPDEVSVWLHITAANFNDPSIAHTWNQQSLGNALQNIAGGGGNAVTNALQGVSSVAGLRQSYNQLSGQTRPPLAPVTVAGTSRFLGTVSSRLQSIQGGVAGMFDGPGLYAMAGPDSSMSGGQTYDTSRPSQAFSVGNGSRVLPDSRFGLWGRGYGLYGDRETETEMPGYAYNVYGGSVGVDYQFTETWLAGIVMGLSDGDVDYAASRDNTDFRAKHVGVYASAAWEKWYLDSVATIADVDYETERYVDLLGERLTAEFDGGEVAAYLEVGQNWDLAPDLRLQPLASLQYAYVSLDSYTEAGGASALRYKKQTHESVKSSLGARLTRRLIESAGDFRADAQLRGRWVHEFGDDRSNVDTAFVSSPASVFTVRDEKISRDSILLGFGLAATTGKQTRVYFDFDTRLNDDESVHIVSAALQYRW